MIPLQAGLLRVINSLLTYCMFEDSPLCAADVDVDESLASLCDVDESLASLCDVADQWTSSVVALPISCTGSTPSIVVTAVDWSTVFDVLTLRAIVDSVDAACCWFQVYGKKEVYWLSCSLMTSSCTLRFPATRYTSPVNAWCPASVFCGTGVHLVGCSWTPQRRNWSGLAPGHRCDSYRLLIALLRSTRWTFSRVMLFVTSGFCWTVNSRLSIT